MAILEARRCPLRRGRLNIASLLWRRPHSTHATTCASLCLRTIRAIETIAYGPFEQEITVPGFPVRILNISEMIVTPSIPS
jgi:hypothetical protein